MGATIHVDRAYVTIATRLIHDKRLLSCPCYSSSEVPFSFLISTFYCPEFAIVGEDLGLYGSGHLFFAFFYRSSTYPSKTTLVFSLCIYVHIFVFQPQHHDCWSVASHLIPNLRRTHVCAPLANRQVSFSPTDRFSSRLTWLQTTLPALRSSPTTKDQQHLPNSKH